MAILFGTIVGGLSAGRDGSPVLLVVLVMVFAVASWLASRLILKTGGTAPDLAIDLNIVRSTGHLVRQMWQHSRIWRANLIVCWFWAIGAVVLPLVSTLTKNTLGGSEGVATVYLAVFSIGIAAGSALASWLASGRIILLPSPIGAVTMGIFMLDLASVTLKRRRHRRPSLESARSSAWGPAFMSASTFSVSRSPAA